MTVQHKKSTIRRKCNMKIVEHKKKLHENSATRKKEQHKISATQEKSSLIRVQH